MPALGISLTLAVILAASLFLWCVQDWRRPNDSGEDARDDLADACWSGWEIERPSPIARCTCIASPCECAAILAKYSGHVAFVATNPSSTKREGQKRAAVHDGEAGTS